MPPLTEIDLAGTWEFRLDPHDLGCAQRWFDQPLPDRVSLPGSLDENGRGEPNLEPRYLGGLSRKVRYTGPAWYAKSVETPRPEAARLLLTLERVHWFSDVWVNGEYVGGCDSLSVPHRYDLTRFAGEERLRIAIRVDNTPKIPIGRIGHALTDWTQTNWNGIVGRMSLEAAPATVLDRLALTTDEQTMRIAGSTTAPAKVAIRLEGSSETVVGPSSVSEAFEAIVPVPNAEPWSDGEPNLRRLAVEVEGRTVERCIGFRSIRTQGKQILLNGHPLFLRGTLENCVFPKTGYPPTNPDSWRRVMARAREYGLNHIRFHSWCPPEAAFQAADEAGVILQVELPLWTGLWAMSSDGTLVDFCRREAHRILQEYGHHPSFALFTLGNEMAFYGEEPEVDALLEELRSCYPNRLYNFSSHGTHLSPACDYYVQADNGKPGGENRPLRGSTWFGVGSRFDREPPNTLETCDAAATEFDRPVVAHEVGEWAVFPDVDNERRYDGVLEARNFRTIRAMLEERGMGSQSPAFTRASGKLSAMLYKEEIEAILRTRGVAGYQLLGLTDFPGQGTATVGMLDAFWDDKGFVTAEEFRESCAPTVPLLRVAKAVWSAAERYLADVSVFHSGRLAANVETAWTVVDDSGTTVREGTLGCFGLESGTTDLGGIEFGLSGLKSPARYTLALEAGGLGRNRWPFWVYPAVLPDIPLESVLVAGFYRHDVRQALMEGRRVWLRIDPGRTWTGIPGRFAPAFWSPIHFREQVGTMGTLIDAGHPVFGRFPTSFHTEWQWWDVLTASKAMVLDPLPRPYTPILQVIDRFERNHKLGTLFEARVGEGRILVTNIDFDRPGRLAARQLEHSIRAYLAGNSFDPCQELTLADLDRLFEREP
ncbi:MAG TPA: hypothetical protein VGE01_00790 [Fimbriimonas sp.]